MIHRQYVIRLVGWHKHCKLSVPGFEHTKQTQTFVLHVNGTTSCRPTRARSARVAFAGGAFFSWQGHKLEQL